MKISLRIVYILFFLLISQIGHSQIVGLKTSLSGWATTTPNLSIEMALGMKTTLDIQGRYNPFRLSNEQKNKKLQHWIVMPELRHWIYEKYDGHFLATHVFYGRYNAGGVELPLGIWEDLKDYRFEGDGLGIGFSYGYQWILSPHWNLEATFGFGYAYLDYKQYEPWKCGEFIGKGYKHYFGPTKVGLSFVYLFKSKKN